MSENKDIYHVQIYCGNCRRRTYPIIIANEDFEYEDPIIEIEPIYSSDGAEVIGDEEIIKGYNVYNYGNKLLRCATLECNKTFLATTISIDGQELSQKVVPKEQSWQRKPKYVDVEKLPNKPFLLYNEAVNAFNQEMRTSCGFLLGAILESICIEEGIKAKKINEEEAKRQKQINDFEQKIKKAKESHADGSEFEKKKKDIESMKIIVQLETMVNILINTKRLSNHHLKLAHIIRDFRNDTTHDIYIPKRIELETSLTMIEELLDEIYIKNKRIDMLNSQMVSFKKSRKSNE